MPSHEQNLELFQLLETARCRISELKANPNAHPGELKQWERTEERLVHDLITVNEGLVRSISGRYAGRLGKYEELKDVLFSDGCFGLSKAIQKFDWRRDYAFSTYAYQWIKQAISRSPAFKGSLHVPEGRLSEIRKVKSVQGRLRQASGVEPTAEEIAWEMGLSEEKVRSLLASDLQIVSMAAPVGDDGGITYGDLIADLSAEVPHEAAERADMLELVVEAAKTLTGLEREVFLMFMDDPRRSLEATGKSLGRTGERIRQIRSGVFEKIRAYIEGVERQTPACSLRPAVVKHGNGEADPVGEHPVLTPVYKADRPRLKTRRVGSNPNHHIWNNNGTWFCKFRVHAADGGTKYINKTLKTKFLEEARKRRDEMMAAYSNPVPYLAA
jgi:RNA polymerase sigma factor (sigma-70 family)